MPSAPSLIKNGLDFKVDTSQVTIMLIHGLTGMPTEMKFLANYFYRKGFSSICPRLAHHGEPIQVLKRAKWQEFYQSVREALLKIPSTQKVYVAGLSAGALLALLLAEEFPDRILGATGLSPTLFYDGWNIPWTHWLLPLAYFTPLRYVSYFKEEPPYGIKNQFIRRKIHTYYEQASINDSSEVAKYGYPYYPVTLFCELRSLIRYVKKKLPSIQIPVQLIQAKDDDMTSVKNSQYIHDHIASREKEIVLLYDSYHLITADQERETVAVKMHEFLLRILGTEPDQNLKREESVHVF